MTFHYWQYKNIKKEVISLIHVNMGRDQLIIRSISIDESDNISVDDNCLTQCIASLHWLRRYIFYDNENRVAPK